VKEYDKHVQLVLKTLKKHDLVVNPEKCSLDVKTIGVLGFGINKRV
jgi:hypothetical protein